MRHRQVLIAALFLLTLTAGTTVTAQGSSSWQVAAVDVLVLQSSLGLRVFPSPDGRHVAYERAVRLNGHFDRFMCTASVAADEEPLCLEPPQDMPRGFDADAGSHFIPLSWSPDSTALAVVGQPLLTLSDTDLWIMDLDAGTWITLTDDGYEGMLVASDNDPAPPPGVSVEVQPAWSPDGTQIAVERTLVNSDGLFAPSTLSLIDVARGDLADLTPLPGSTEGQPDAGSTTAIAWSPDGSALAISLRHRELDTDNDGVWLVDVAGGDMEPLVSWSSAEDAWQRVYAGLPLDTVGPVFGSPDGARLLFWGGNLTTRPVAAWPFLIDLASREIAALPLPAHPDDTETRRGIWPFQTAWSPDGGALLVATNGAHPDELRTSLDPEGPRARVGVRLIDLASGESILYGQLPAGEAAPFYFATWGPAGDVILNSYHLVMARE